MSSYPGLGWDASSAIYHILPVGPLPTSALEVEVKHCLTLWEEIALSMCVREGGKGGGWGVCVCACI